MRQHTGDRQPTSAIYKNKAFSGVCLRATWVDERSPLGTECAWCVDVSLPQYLSNERKTYLL
ncbi:hypothetical protein [Tolypothrix sp. VBCCA 56010]|uniref:hypothetical protein n=1 Tax=Tolypothrix sp. VBCCA 56010 TaxID=3137731 RepID=UPI003D7D477D